MGKTLDTQIPFMFQKTEISILGLTFFSFIALQGETEIHITVVVVVVAVAAMVVATGTVVHHHLVIMAATQIETITDARPLHTIQGDDILGLGRDHTRAPHVSIHIISIISKKV